MTCPCGRKATHRVPVDVSCLRGTARRWERLCADHADRLAAQQLVAGKDAVTVESLEEE